MGRALWSSPADRSWFPWRTSASACSAGVADQARAGANVTPAAVITAATVRRKIRVDCTAELGKIRTLPTGLAVSKHLARVRVRSQPERGAQPVDHGRRAGGAAGVAAAAGAFVVSEAHLAVGLLRGADAVLGRLAAQAVAVDA